MNLSPAAGFRLLVSVLAVSLVSGVRSASADAGVQLRRTAIPPEISGLSTAELIERLQDVAGYTAPTPPQPKSGKVYPSWGGSLPLRSADLDWNFPPLQSSTGGIIRDGKRTPSSPILVELIARGVGSVPLLLAHLTDPRFTHCAESVNFINGSTGFGDVYDPRDRAKKWQLPTVNQLRPETFRPIPTDPYVMRVGDLCFYALGQIVNRRLDPKQGGLATPETYYVRASTINSPVQTPELADIARVDWSGLTAQSHCASLLADAQADARDSRRPLYEPALRRSFFYYPAEGAKEAERRVTEELDTGSVRLRYTLLVELEDFDWASRERAYSSLFVQAMALPVSDAVQRFARDDLAVQIVKRIRPEQFDPATKGFFTAELAWWETWQKETKAASWFGTNGPTAGLSNLWPLAKKWSDAARAIVKQADGLAAR